MFLFDCEKIFLYLVNGYRLMVNGYQLIVNGRREVIVCYQITNNFNNQ
jgi:hypothetical protein